MLLLLFFMVVCTGMMMVMMMSIFIAHDSINLNAKCDEVHHSRPHIITFLGAKSATDTYRNLPTAHPCNLWNQTYHRQAPVHCRHLPQDQHWMPRSQFAAGDVCVIHPVVGGLARPGLAQNTNQTLSHCVQLHNKNRSDTPC